MAEELSLSNKLLINNKAKVRLMKFYCHAFANALDFSGNLNFETQILYVLSMAIIGNFLIGQENLSYSIPNFFDENSKSKCVECGSLNSPFYFDNQLQLVKKNLDFSSTYEGAEIVSDKFRHFCISNNFENVLFTPINSTDMFYYFLVLGQMTEVDTDKSQLTIGKLCSTCGFNKEVFGGSKLFIKDQTLKGFYTTDIFWRTHYIFRPRFIVDLETAKLLKSQKFKGLFFKEVYSA